MSVLFVILWVFGYIWSSTRCGSKCRANSRFPLGTGERLWNVFRFAMCSLQIACHRFMDPLPAIRCWFSILLEHRCFLCFSTILWIWSQFVCKIVQGHLRCCKLFTCSRSCKKLGCMERAVIWGVTDTCGAIGILVVFTSDLWKHLDLIPAFETIILQISSYNTPTDSAADILLRTLIKYLVWIMWSDLRTTYRLLPVGNGPHEVVEISMRS